MTNENLYAPPSRNPADNDTLTGLLKLAFTKFLQKTDDMLPAQVIEYSPATNMVQVQPTIVVVSTANQQIPRPQIAAVPVLQLSGGGFADYIPCNPGDKGWLKANDRDISLFKQTGQTSSPNTQRKHSFEDGIFIPQAVWSLITLNPEDFSNRVIQNYAGTVKISLWPSLIKILAPDGVHIGQQSSNSAILELNSTTQAFLLPRMTTGQKLAIPDPVDGMQVYDLTEKAVSTHSNGSWS